MKKGWRIVIHKDVPAEYMDEAKGVCDRFIDLAMNGWSYPTDSGVHKVSDSYNSGYRHSWYRRQVLGRLLANNTLSFRRLCKNRRIFGVVPVSLLVKADGSAVITDICMCAKCHYGINGKVVMTKPYTDEDYTLYSEYGDIKG